jgi:cysteine-rich repeat protein
LATACAPEWSPPEAALTEGRPNAEDTGESGEDFEYGVCGNGLHEPGESCDDEDEIWGDGCNPDCHLGGDLLWRDSLLTVGNTYSVDALERFPDGTVVLVAKDLGYPYECLSAAWRADGSPAWTHVPEDFQSQSDAPRQTLMHEGHLFIADRWRQTPMQGGTEWGLRLQEFDVDGQLLSSIDLPLTRSSQLNYPIVYLEPVPGGLRVVAELDGELDVHRLDLQSGEWSLEVEPFALSVASWQRVVSHAKLPDDTDLYLVRAEGSAVNWLYRVGADRAVTEWDILVIAGHASMQVRNESVYLFVQPDWWDYPYVWQYDLEANFVNSWPMVINSGEGSFFFENLVAAWFGSEEIIAVGTDYGHLGRQTLSGEDRWVRVYMHGGYRPERVSVGGAVSDPIIVAGRSIDRTGQNRLYVEARSP